MNIRVSKWGNSLALHIPTSIIKKFNLKDGNSVEVTLTSDGALVIRPQKLDRKTLAKMAKELRDSMKMGTSVIEELRSGARY